MAEDEPGKLLNFQDWKNKSEQPSVNPFDSSPVESNPDDQEKQRRDAIQMLETRIRTWQRELEQWQEDPIDFDKEMVPMPIMIGAQDVKNRIALLHEYLGVAEFLLSNPDSTPLEIRKFLTDTSIYRSLK
jgi:hypothetical protein